MRATSLVVSASLPKNMTSRRRSTPISWRTVALKKSTACAPATRWRENECRSSTIGRWFLALSRSERATRPSCSWATARSPVPARLGALEAARAETRAHGDATRHLVGYLLAVAAASLWAIGGVFAKMAFARGIAPAELAELRIGLGFLMFALIVGAFRPKAARVARGHVPLLIAFGVIGMAGVQLSYYEAIKRLPIVLALLIQYLAPPFVLGYS